ncbi:aminodeoxychorismate synthase, component I [Saccharospirillum sp. MSK14-1]|uniref:aminodeoxychorismate synthase component I n=1 Tax=Saccharospirillum sp. MSK14-1 TaxID=1897632 RepID=UPI000D49D70F|nr:aminodeoxychorismate synthase component I [Saccharospirillum sp. MSK14-1]PTY36682.1 aminodeoxychorismate synthase, component I [Saccharospirillum sp. MSK14-1]
MQRIELPYAASARPWFQHLANEPGAIWFHSGQADPQHHRWEWCSAWPSERFRFLGHGQVEHRHGHHIDHITVDDFSDFLSRYRRDGGAPDLPFASGLAGHFDYDAGFESQQIDSRHTAEQCLASVDRYDWSLVLDHQQSKAWLMIHPDCPAAVVVQLERLKAIKPEREPIATSPAAPLQWRSMMTRNQYQHRFEQLQQHILDGDIYQANLTRQWQADCPNKVDDWALYQQLIEHVPAPFSAYHRATDHSLLSVSPERFLTIDHGAIVTQPIKGTRPRGTDTQSDYEQALALQNSTKDRAENLMIVDLLRNDLARNALPGSVQVPKLFELMSYSNVHHLVSTVTAQLQPQASPLKALFDAFPGGSITGAPKRRAMQIIDELELASRASYCGSAFWFSDDGYLDSNILIRSLVRRGQSVTCAGGGGIVADSDADSEYAESATKVRQLLESLGRVQAD